LYRWLNSLAGIENHCYSNEFGCSYALHLGPADECGMHQEALYWRKGTNILIVQALKSPLGVLLVSNH